VVISLIELKGSASYLCIWAVWGRKIPGCIASLSVKQYPKHKCYNIDGIWFINLESVDPGRRQIGGMSPWLKFLASSS